MRHFRRFFYTPSAPQDPPWHDRAAALSRSTPSVAASPIRAGGARGAPRWPPGRRHPPSSFPFFQLSLPDTATSAPGSSISAQLSAWGPMRSTGTKVLEACPSRLGSSTCSSATNPIRKWGSMPPLSRSGTEIFRVLWRSQEAHVTVRVYLVNFWVSLASGRDPRWGDVPVGHRPRDLLWYRSRRGSRGLLATVVPPLSLGRALLLATLRPGLLVARLAGLLPGPCSG